MTKQKSPGTVHLRPRGPTPPARRKGNVWLAVVGYAGLGLACLLLGAVAFLLVAAPVDLVRDRLVQEVKARTGRDLVVSGPTSLSLFPQPSISFAKVAFSAPPEMGGDPTLQVQTLKAEVGLASLLTGKADLKRVVLMRPSIELRVNAQGQRSWDVMPPARASASAASSGGPAQHTTAREAARPRDGAGRRESLASLSALTVTITDGTVRYVDERSDTRHQIDALALELAIREGAGPVAIKGSLTWRGERLALEGTLSQLRALLEDEAARLSLKVAGRPIDASYDGAFGGRADTPVLDGNVSLRASSLQALGALAGKPLAAGRDVGPISLSGAVTSHGGRTSIERLSATFGNASASGALAIEGKGPKPHVTGSLRLSELDLGEILVRPAGAPGRSGATPAPRAADPIEDVLRRDGAPVALADADLELSSESLIYKDMKTGPTRLTLQLKGGVATLTIDDMQLYGGSGQGHVILDGSGQVPATRTEIRLEGVAAQPLLKGAIGLDWLEGQGRIALSLTGRGTSERQIVESLNGRVDMSATNGAIDAIDVGKILRSLEQGRFSGLRSGAGDKTPFSELAGTFTIANGVAQNQDLRLVSPDMRFTGSGSFNLGARSLDYTVRPKVANVNATSERAVINLSNVEIPVRIHGSWEKPNFTVAGQEQLIETMREIGKKLKGQDVEDVLKGLLGGKGEGERTKPRDILDKLFKKQ
jgi:AsmA protein